MEQMPSVGGSLLLHLQLTPTVGDRRNRRELTIKAVEADGGVQQGVTSISVFSVLIQARRDTYAASAPSAL